LLHALEPESALHAIREARRTIRRIVPPAWGMPLEHLHAA
jgi:hypothetical protein